MGNKSPILHSVVMALGIVVGLCLWGPGTATAQAADIRVAAATQQEIYVGEPFQYQIIIDGHDAPGKADVSVLAGFSVQSQGGRDVSQRSVTIINGRRSEQSVKRYVMVYSLTAGQAGSATIPAVSVEVDGHTYKTNTVPINVLSPQTTDKLDLEITLSETDVYVGQPVACTVTWYIDGTVVNGVGDFHFTAPFLAQPELWRIEEAAPPAEGAKAFQLDLAGQPVIASQQTCQHGGRACLAVSWQRILIPRQPGQRSLDAQVACKMDTSTRRRANPFDIIDRMGDRRDYKRFVTTASPVRMSVKALPGTSQPADFAGLVGRYTIATEARPTDVNVGDPITLTIRIAGELPSQVTMPDLESVEALAKDFKIPSDQSAPKVVGQAKVFTQTIRPIYETVEAIPAIPLSYFDVDKGRYVTVRSEPIPLQVSATKLVTAEQGIGAAPVGARAQAITAVQGGMAANYEGPALLENRAFSLRAALVSPVYLGVWVAPLLWLTLVVLVQWLGGANPQRRQAQRRATACKRALRQLKHISGQGAAAAAEMADLMRQYVGERCERPAQSLTVTDCRDVLAQQGCPGRPVEAFCQILERYEQSRFAGGAAQVSADPREAALCLEELEKELKSCQKG